MKHKITIKEVAQEYTVMIAHASEGKETKSIYIDFEIYKDGQVGSEICVKHNSVKVMGFLDMKIAIDHYNSI